MIYCPNKNTTGFKELVAATDDTLAYYYWHTNKGNPLDLTPSGKESKLFNDLLVKHNGNRIAAIAEKSKYYDKVYLATDNWIDSGVEPDMIDTTQTTQQVEPSTVKEGVDYSNNITTFLSTNNISSKLSTSDINKLYKDKALHEYNETIEEFLQRAFCSGLI